MHESVDGQLEPQCNKDGSGDGNYLPSLHKSSVLRCSLFSALHYDHSRILQSLTICPSLPPSVPPGSVRLKP
jgi:hypothetical protein